MIERAVTLPGGAFVVAVCVALVLTPAVRRLALDIAFVDRPGAHKSHHTPVPYLGGVAVAGAFVAGLLSASGALNPLGVLITAGALGMCGLGLLDDDRTLLPAPRLLVQVGAASVVVAAGVRVDVTGMWVYDLVLTMVWVLGITNAVNFLDNMDGLAGGLSAAASAAIFTIAVRNGDAMIATMAASIFGACLGFLSVNVRPAGIYLGDTGSLFLGFLLAVLSIEVRSDLAPPASFLVPALLVALPVLDISLVTVSRLRRRIPVSTGGRNHLSHRLVARGLSPGAAVAVLIGVEAIAGVLAVATAQGAVPLPWIVVPSVVVIGSLLIVVVPAPVFDEPVQGLDPRLRLALGSAIVAVVMVALPAALALLTSRSDMRDGSRSLTAALSAAHRGDADGVERNLDQAQRSFDRIEARLDGPLVSVGLVVPVVNVNIRAGRALATTAGELASAADELALAADPEELSVFDGTVRIDRVDEVARDLAHLAGTVRRALSQLDGVDQPFLLPPIRSPVDGLRDGLPALLGDLEQAESFARALGPLAGGEQDRRYLVVHFDRVPTAPPSESVVVAGELTASGGVLSWAPVDTSSGALLPISRTDPELAAQLDGTVDFASAARELVEFRAATDPVDGVIGVDEVGVTVLAALSGRPDLASEGLSPVVEAMLHGELGSPARIARYTGDAARFGHLRLYSIRPSEQVLAARLRSGGTPADASDAIAASAFAGSDSTSVVSRVSYDIDLDPQPTQLRIIGRLRIVLDPTRRDAPSTSGHVALRTSLDVTSVMVDGRQRVLETDDDAHIVDVDVRDGPVTVEFAVIGHAAVDADGRYALDLPTWVGTPASADVRLTALDRWNLTEIRAGEETSSSATASVVRRGLDLGTDQRIVVELSRDVVSQWQALVRGSD